MTTEELLELENFEKAATPGPWFVTGMDLLTDKGKEVTDIFIVSDNDEWLFKQLDSTKDNDAKDAYLVASLRQNAIALISDAKKCIEQDDYIRKLETQIRYIRDQRGDDKCWQDFEALYALLPEGYVRPSRDETVELELCKKYIASCHNPAIKYVSPQRRIEELKDMIELLFVNHGTLAADRKEITRFITWYDESKPDVSTWDTARYLFAKAWMLIQD